MHLLEVMDLSFGADKRWGVFSITSVGWVAFGLKDFLRLPVSGLFLSPSGEQVCVDW